ncbi:MAG: SDR family oxidoreductase [Candidatus Lambdaproteobacteria bacterium]|nr:SDR family oxidoreductase [Candidatus Lambdaproteobacteria bacterium]
MDNLLDLKGRIGLVTGAGQGVGRQIALHFAAHRAGGVVVNDFYRERAEAVVREVQAAGVKALAVVGDISDYQAVQQMARQAEQTFGRVDILVNNAGNAGPVTDISSIPPFLESDPASWQTWFGTNLFGVLNLSRALVGGMVQRGYGRVITVISDAGRVGEPHLAVYSAAKAGAAGFMRALAKGVGRANVTVNCVAPGTIQTPATAGLLEDQETLRKILRLYMIRRLGEPSDIANMVLFLASDAAGWVTGQTFPVNGGYSVSV